MGVRIHKKRFWKAPRELQDKSQDEVRDIFDFNRILVDFALVLGRFLIDFGWIVGLVPIECLRTQSSTQKTCKLATCSLEPVIYKYKAYRTLLHKHTRNT